MSAPTPEPLGTAPLMDPPATPPPARGRRWIPLVVVAVAAMLLGAAIATVTVLKVNGGRVHRYDVSAFLAQDATTAQKAAVRTALDTLHPVDGIQFEDRQQAWARFKEMFKDRPDLVNSTKPENLPESFRLTTSGAEFACPALNAVRRLDGVDEVVVVQRATKGHPGAEVKC